LEPEIAVEIELDSVCHPDAWLAIDGVHERRERAGACAAPVIAHHDHIGQTVAGPVIEAPPRVEHRVDRSVWAGTGAHGRAILTRRRALLDAYRPEGRSGFPSVERLVDGRGPSRGAEVVVADIEPVLPPIGAACDGDGLHVGLVHTLPRAVNKNLH